MSVQTIKLPDVGEGIAEAEFVELLVQQGDVVKEDQPLAEVMTDKATVEIPSPTTGTVIWVGPEVGETVAVGTDVFKLETDAKAASIPPATAEKPKSKPTPTATKTSPKADIKAAPNKKSPPLASPTAPAQQGRALASPAVRQRAEAMALDIAAIKGSGPSGRVTHADLDALSGKPPVIVTRMPAGEKNTHTEDIKIIGMRKRIAENMQNAKRRIPHFGYVEEVDVTALEDLRAHLNTTQHQRGKLTVLPFLIKALSIAIAEFPQMNVRFDDEKNVVTQFGALHAGIATQTENGLMVPVLRHAEALDLWEMAEEVKRLAEAARDGIATSKELSGSTLTITSLGANGGIATIPVINYPEAAIIGVNKIMTRPVYNTEGQVVPRKMMNLSSSFDHRVIDGWDAAQFIQRLKSLLENPATLFM